MVSVLAPLLFSLHIIDITSDIESEIRLFAEDCVCYREIKNVEDTVKPHQLYLVLKNSYSCIKMNDEICQLHFIRLSLDA